jgi:hypothetical protein
MKMLSRGRRSCARENIVVVRAGEHRGGARVCGRDGRAFCTSVSAESANNGAVGGESYGRAVTLVHVHVGVPAGAGTGTAILSDGGMVARVSACGRESGTRASGSRGTGNPAGWLALRSIVRGYDKRNRACVNYGRGRGRVYKRRVGAIYKRVWLGQLQQSECHIDTERR